MSLTDHRRLSSQEGLSHPQVVSSRPPLSLESHHRVYEYPGGNVTLTSTRHNQPSQGDEKVNLIADLIEQKAKISELEESLQACKVSYLHIKVRYLHITVLYLGNLYSKLILQAKDIYGGPEVHTSSIRQAFGDSSLLRFERAFYDSNTSLQRFEGVTFESLRRFGGFFAIRTYSDSNEPTAIQRAFSDSEPTAI